MAISQIIAAIDRLLPGVTIKDGGEHLGEQLAPPRIVFVPTDEQIRPAEPRWIGPPRCLALREVTLVAHLWGSDREEVESLLNRLVYAVRLAVGTSYRLASGHWPQQDSQALMQLGRTYTLPITFLIPIVVPAGMEGEATITDTDTTDTTTAEAL